MLSNWWVFKKRMHMSWLVMVLSIGMVAGIAIAPYIAFPVSGLWTLPAVLLVVMCLLLNRICVIPFLLVAGVALGIWRGEIDLGFLLPYKNAAKHIVTVRGSVKEDPESGKTHEVILKLDRIVMGNKQLGGTLWISATDHREIKRQDIVTVTGKLNDGFGSFAGSIYQASVKKVERPIPGDVAGQARDWFAEKIRKVIPDPEASLGIGYLVGQKGTLSNELNDVLRLTGLTHIVVASGYNLTILVRLTRRMFMKISKYTAAISASLLILLFITVTGASPSMSRAGFVTGISLLAWYYGRKIHPFVLLFFTAAITLMIQPSYGWSDVGWLLSFTSFAGVMIVAPLLQRYLFGDKKPGTVRQIIGETMSAQIATLPILVYYFGQFSNIALISNLLILPFVPLAMLLTFVAGVCAVIAPISSVGIPAYALLKYMIETIQNLAAIPGAQTGLSVNLWMAMGYYCFICVVCFIIWRCTRLDLRNTSAVE